MVQIFSIINTHAPKKEGMHESSLLWIIVDWEKPENSMNIDANGYTFSGVKVWSWTVVRTWTALNWRQSSVQSLEKSLNQTHGPVHGSRN